ncbi:sorbosone dehydrogenase family protein [Ideonella sp. A 288]|uniref:PQQ-dependent sugar dehydrogenase n=1 Tax=Ideonella sp. A 288 TaxID=1962181 RepID=UPI0013032D15|nr:PQQ-dependent sugar dehydrogenase [Ideonella sp. A 288]
MKRSAGLAATLSTSLWLCLAALMPAQAAPVITNGGFESGFVGWTRVDQLGSDGSFLIQSGLATPITGFPVPAPPGGNNAAMTDATGPGSHVLYQDFTASAANATLSFDLYLNNVAGLYATPNSLAFDLTSQVAAQAQNQQARVDILRAGADPMSMEAADILLTLFQVDANTPLEFGYQTFSADVSALLAAHAGESLRLRFAEVDNIFNLYMGVDNVRLNVVPEPGSLWLLGLALGGLIASRARALRRAARSAAALALLGAAAIAPLPARADTTPTVMLDPTLQVTTVLAAGLTQPIGIVFLGSTDDYLVLEKASGQIKRVVNGAIDPTPVLDLAVNSNSERGLLSMALHPDFPRTPFAYIYWTESSTGADTNVVANVPLLGNRVDRFAWDGSTLVFDRNIVRLRSRQTDNVPVPGHPGSNNANEAGNHNGGVIRFGPDGKLYIFMGDQGRRGWLQNLANGPFLTAPQVDDTFGGPAPDDAHLSGVILRLSDDGTTPADNPFFAAGAGLGGEVGANVQKIYSYGHRNGFGMAFDPYSGSLWDTENADDAYAEINRIVPGLNGGWIQFAGPSSRVPSFKLIETTQFGRALQQVRYPPTRVSYTSAAALSRLVMLPGAVYKDPELSWRYESGPSGATFVKGTALGAAYDGTLWIGSSRGFAQVGANGGALYRIKLTADRMNVDVSADPRLADRVADNLFRAQKFEGTESETLVIGRGFGTTPSIEQAPDGDLYVVSLTDNTIYKISRVPQ